ncbi:L-histidine N(alpha)-methyltransferase [Rubrobacter taiwanensis]|jgi:L-histidine N-alpha-methyltransferase|uniref:L-histidine N(Alpha)-methyltransferase n=1 Tax=Rubrobacter taiwanensis TaxID=185139 RepID=A0A4R1BRQ8_9ACTN|nr:L-histidine N(alpha)-methyltransferase [Rubrobacter taiwanensis]TCJ20037.1 L-histidine N(alpha)-methyltransferase [Rubrobacter taiwanensis]
MIRIETLEAPGRPETGEEVRTGLTALPKDLSAAPRYFYDELGSELFERITQLPEYYQTRAEHSILRERSDEIVARSRPGELIELGSGSAGKTRTLLDALRRAGGPVRYAPLDVSGAALRESARRLAREYPGIRIRGFAGDFNGPLDRVLEGAGRRLVVFLGGTVGNFTPAARREFLEKVRRGLGPGDRFLVGLDLVKDRATLEAAYNDSAGVTAEFNRNMLRNINRELGGDFDPEAFEHRAFYNERDSRIEMWLQATGEQEVRVRELDLTVRFAAGEGVRTEISAKFTRRTAGEVFAEAGFRLENWYTDREGLFGLALFRVG